MVATFEVDKTTGKYVELNNFYNETFGTDIVFPSYTNPTYDAFMLAVKAIEEVGYDGKEIASWMRDVKNWYGTSGYVSIGDNGERSSAHTPRVFKNGEAVAVNSDTVNESAVE